MMRAEYLPVAVILTLSVIAQLTAAGLALRLVHVTGHRVAWRLISAALLLMAVRRGLPLARIIAGDARFTPDLLGELVGLTLSVLMTAGMACIGPFLRLNARSAEDLLERERRLRSLIEASPVAMIVSSGAEERVQFINRKFTELFGYTLEDMPDVAHWWPLAYPDPAYRQDIRSRWASQVARARAQGGEVDPMEASVRCKDGSVREVEFRLSSLGEGHLVTAVDLTARKQVERKLHLSEERLRLTMEATRIGIWDWDLTHNVAFASPTYFTMLGYPPEEQPLERSTWLERVHPDDRALVAERLEAAVHRDIHDYHYEARFRHADGGYRWLDVHGFAMERDAEGKATRLLGTRVDVSDRRRAEVALRESEERYRLLHEHAGMGIGYYSPDGVVISYNRMAASHMGGKPEDFAGKSMHQLFPPAAVAEYLERLGRAVAASEPVEYEDRVELPTGTRWFLSVFARVCSQQGEVLGVQIMSKDVTERHRVEEELQRHRDRLEELVAERTAALEATNRELEGFSYSISHDLRTPLRAIDGFSQKLLQRYEASTDAEAKRLVRVVRANTAKMSRLIDDILGFLRAGRVALHRREVDMERLVREVWTELESHEGGRCLHLELGPLPRARGDAAMLRQVWVNLLGNAVKFTRTVAEARVEVGGERTDSETRYFVRDNGTGFDAAYAEKLFGVFQRLHGVEEFEGTGIGLAIVKRIVGRHGGRVEAEGAVGRGATFCFALPLEAPRTEPPL